jgi:hypothetical protein
MHETACVTRLGFFFLFVLIGHVHAFINFLLRLYSYTMRLFQRAVCRLHESYRLQRRVSCMVYHFRLASQQCFKHAKLALLAADDEETRERLKNSAPKWIQDAVYSKQRTGGGGQVRCMSVAILAGSLACSAAAVFISLGSIALPQSHNYPLLRQAYALTTSETHPLSPTFCL